MQRELDSHTQEKNKRKEKVGERERAKSREWIARNRALPQLKQGEGAISKMVYRHAPIIGPVI